MRTRTGARVALLLTLPQNPTNEPWCFQPASYSPCSPAVQGSSAGNPFTDADVASMRSFFIANLDLNGTGAVMASPDPSVLNAGSYRFHWSRDAALSMRVFFETGANRSAVLSTVRHHQPPRACVFFLMELQMARYAAFEDNSHHQPDPFGLNVLVEPKVRFPPHCQ